MRQRSASGNGGSVVSAAPRTAPRATPPAGPVAGPQAFPQGSLAPGARAASDPRPREESGTSTPRRGRFSPRKGGSLAAPTLTPKGRVAGAQSRRGEPRSCPRGRAKALAKGGFALVAQRNGSGSAPQPCFPRRNRARIAPRAGTPAQLAIRVGGAPISDPLTGRTRRGWPTRPRHGGGRGPGEAIERVIAVHREDWKDGSQHRDEQGSESKTARERCYPPAFRHRN